MEEVVEEKEEVNGNNGNGNVEKKKRKRKVKRKLSRHASSVTNRKNPFTPTMLYYAGKIATQNNNTTIKHYDHVYEIYTKPIHNY